MSSSERRTLASAGRSSQANAEGTAACGIAVMAKASEAGRTKTRLVPPLSFDEAAALNTAFLRDVAASLINAGAAASIAPYVAFGPPGSEPFFRRALPADIGLMEVWFANFGDCLLETIRALLERGHPSAVVLNSDSPTLPTSLLIEAAMALAQPGQRAVLGPAHDGGYYLLGLKHAHRRMFEDIDWSTSRVARQTVERAAEIGLPVHVLPTWYDVDDVEALRTLHAELCCGHSFDPALRPGYPVYTAALVDSLLAESDFADRIAVAGDMRARRPQLLTNEMGDGTQFTA
jgi:rSAM/selenodomain-associated transferase 1